MASLMSSRSRSRDCESLEIAGHRLQLHSLAQLLRRLHELASDLAAFKESVWERPGAEPTHQSEAQ